VPATYTDADIAKVDGAQPAQTYSDADIAAHDQVSGNGGFGSTVGRFASDLPTGIVKGAASTLFHAGDLIRRGETAVKNALPNGIQDWLDSAPQEVKNFAGYGNRPLDNPDVQAGTTPKTPGEKTGAMLEHAAEFAVPASRIAKLSQLAAIPGAVGIMARGSLQAIGAAGVAGVQTSGDPTAMTEAGLTAGGLSVGAGVGKAALRVGKALVDSGAAGDALGLVSPRLKHGIDFMGKLKGALFPAGTAPAATAATDAGATAATATSAAPSVIPAEGYSGGVRPDWRQGIVNELNPDTPASSNPQSSPASSAAAPTTGGNQFEAQARAEKTKKLAAWLYGNGNGISSADVPRMGPDQWKLASQGAKTNMPSPATTKDVLVELQKLEHIGEVSKQLAAHMAEPPVTDTVQ
jgi:hypothetical protein